MPRSIKKGAYVAHHLQTKLDKLNKENQKGTLKIWTRASTITPDFIGHTIMVHNGRKHIPVYITEPMIGHKLGEFSPTRTYRGHVKKQKSKK